MDATGGGGWGPVGTPAILASGRLEPRKVRHVPPRVLGSAVGGIIVVTNVRTLLRSDWIDAADPVRYGVYVAVFAGWAAALAFSVRQHLTHDRQVPAAVTTAG